MKEVLNFQFYSILKNEDAPPFIGNDFLVAADGLGGAGSSRHTIDEEKYSDFKAELFDAAYGDLDEDIRKDIEEYLYTLVSQIADGASHTSALWASRIIIGRFIYLMIKKEIDGKALDLSDAETREKMSKFISKGLQEVAGKFSLESGEYDSQLLLPSTLAALRFEEKENSVEVECVWAGDSRCYALFLSGLKLLSVDNEDASGAITNLFYVGGKEAVLNYRRYELPKPCAVMVTSDGAFDPFDPEDYLGVEYTFEEAIANAQNVNEMSSMLFEKYNTIRGDDTTVAFSAFGFDSFEQMKESFGARSEYVFELCKKKAELRLKSEIASMPAEEVFGYIKSRTADKYAAISSTMIKLLVSGEEDIVVSDQLKEKVEGLKKKIREKSETEIKAKKSEIIDIAYKTLRDNPAKVLECFDRDAVNADERVSGYYDNLLGVADAYMKSMSSAAKQKEKTSWLDKEREEIRAQITNRLESCYKALRKLAVNGANSEKWNYFIKLQVFWNEVERAFEQNIPLTNYREFVYSSKILSALKIDKLTLSKNNEELMRRIKAYSEKRGTAPDRSKDIAAQQKMNAKKYESALQALFDVIKSVEEPTRFFEKTFREKFEVDLKEYDREELVSEEKLMAFVEEMFAVEKDAIIELIVDALAAFPEKTSAIDIMYNTTKLKRFRVYNSCKDASMQDVVEFKEELRKMEGEYNSLIEDVSE